LVISFPTIPLVAEVDISSYWFNVMLVCFLSVKVVSSSESIIPIGGLAAGNHYQVHVESISLSGVANSTLVSFETQSEPRDWKMLLILVIVPSLIALTVAALIFYR